ncbi:regulator of G protein signaling domain-containing protein [Chlamydoabsidia padenii]|nr:regulator of G protein signaling domain-containing protein [Chlamydoabsidia padenii]
MESDRSRQAYTSMMKFTIDGRPYLKDIHDLFAALIVQIPLTTHRYLFRNYYNTFSSEDAIKALGSLRFSHTVRTPDPNDPSRLTRTTTTTTFNMAKDMAKALCSQFQACRLMQNAVDPISSRSGSASGSSSGSGTISDKAIWQLTPKGLCVLQDFCVRTEVDMSSMRQYFSDIYPIQLVRLDRHSDDDQLMLGRQNVSLIFMVMITSLPLEGNLLTQQLQQSQQNLPVPPLAKSSSKKKKDDQGNGYQQKLASLAKPGKKMRTAFSSQLGCDWLIDYSTVSCYDEGEQLLAEFVKYESVMITTHQITSSSTSDNNSDLTIPRSNSIHKANINDNGFNCRSRPPSTAMDYPSPTTMPSNINSNGNNNNTTSSLSIHNGNTGSNYTTTNGDPKESNATKLKQILDDAQLRSLFKDFLHNNFCEENLDFWIDYSTLRRKIRNQSPALPSQNQKDLLEDAYDLWSTYLKPGAACELNVEHSLRQEMARVVNSMVTVVPTYIPGQQTSKNTLVISSHSVSASLRMILKWLDQVNDHICRLMSSDSVPKFVRTSKYKKIVEARETAERKEQEDMIKQLDEQQLDHHHGSSLLFGVEQRS